MSEKQYSYAVGKRKGAVARVRLYHNGTGKIEVNEKTAKDYFSTSEMVGSLLSPLKISEQDKNFDTVIVVSGGGLQSQAEACRHGIARALIAQNAELRPILKAAGFLTRDARVKERKKPGLHGARRAPQWSKR